MPKTMVEFECAYCHQKKLRDAYEIKRNERLGRANCCCRSCHASYMNKTPKKLKITKKILKKRNANQFREDNPNWKGGVSASSHPLKPVPKKRKGK